MFRSKKEVDRHVSDVLGKIHNENERNLRGYTCARLYFQIKDYETAIKYLVNYLSVRDHYAPAHKLMGQLYEAIGNVEQALHSYKRSLEIDSNQKDLVLKICELYCQLPVDHETARYWADRADQLFPHHEIIFRLRESLISAEGEPDRQELEHLLASELNAQPMNVSIRIKLLKLYLDTERVKEAYAHAMKIENKQHFPCSTDWYYCLIDILEAYQEEVNQELDSDFYMNYLSALDHLIFLTLTESHALRFGFDSKKTNHLSSINDAVSVLCTFDQVLKTACNNDLHEGPWLYFLHHMKGQLYYHMATIIMKRAIKEQGNWKDACRVGAALLLIAYTFKPQNLLQEVWFCRMNERQKLFTSLFQQAALRSSCSGHMIINLCKEEKSKWLQKIRHDVCIAQVQERTYNRIFNNISQQKAKASYFLQDTTFVNSSLEFPSLKALKDYDKSSFKLCSDSLHHLVWLQLQQPKETDENEKFHDSYLREVFKGLQYGNNNLSKGSPESLCLLDVEAFLQAATYTTKLLLERRNSVLPQGGDISLCVSPNICEPLCTKEQASWWKAAYSLLTNTLREKYGEQRLILQRGLEVIRGVGNHGLNVQLVVYLARTFSDRAASCALALKGDNQNVRSYGEKIHLHHRCAHYWNVALGMLERLEQNQIIRTPKECLFVSCAKDLSADEITKLKEEGHLYLACQEMNSGKLEDAISILSKLTSPFASYYMALALKKSAFELVESKCMRDIEAKTWNTRTALLNKAKEALYVTMDRLKGDKSHPLNKDLCVQIEDIEGELNKDLSSSSALDDSGGSEEVDEYDATDSKQISPTSARTSIPNHFSHLSRQSTPRPDSSFLRLKGKCANLNEKNKHLQPSPERLDAQIRALALSQESLVQNVLEQQKVLIDTTKAIAEEQKQYKKTIEELKKQVEELRSIVAKGFVKSSHKKSYMRGQGDDEEEEDYNDFETNAGYVDYYVDDAAADYEFRRSGYQHYVPPQLVSDPPGPSGLGYVHQAPLPAAPPGPSPLNHYGYHYPPHPPIPPPPPSGSAIPEHPQYFHTAPAQGLSFSEGQQLPQFRFHVGSSAAKPPGTANLATIPSIPSSSIMSPSAPLTSKPPPIPSAANSPWAKSASVPHAFQIPLPPAPTNAAFSPAQSPAVLSTPTPFLASSTALQKHIQTTGSLSIPLTPYSDIAPSSQTVSGVSVSSLLSNSIGSCVASPIISGSGFQNRTVSTPHVSRTRCDSDVGESAGSEAEGADVEKEVVGDFKPVIPLPDEVVVETGEENEKVVFEERAKLFRFADHEWKERGIGPVRLLHNELTGKVRLLMRRDQVLKVCANHFIVPSMQLSPMKDSDKAWIWAAQDFADETVKTEKFCIRFKTADVAASFKTAFERCLSIAKEAEADQTKSDEKNKTHPVSVPTKSSVQAANAFGFKFLPKHGSWTCPVCYVSNTADKHSCEACETLKPQQSTQSSSTILSVSPQTAVGSADNRSDCSFMFPPVVFKTGVGEVTVTPKTLDKPVEEPVSSLLKQQSTTWTLPGEAQKSSNMTDSGKTVLGGFTFSSAPVLKDSSTEAKDREILVVHTKAKNGPQVTKVDAAKPSPFSGFSFKSSPLGFGFPSSEAPRTSSSTSFVTDTNISVSPGADGKVTAVPSSDFDEKAESLQPVFGAKSNISSLSFSSLSTSSGGDINFQKSENFQGFQGSGSPLFVTITKEGRRVSGDFGTEGAPEEFEPTTEFRPVVPLPALVEVKTGEEEEEKLFGERAKLFRYDSEGKQWKERGIGELKIMLLPSTGKYRILMRREQVLKICANHSILPEMKLSPLASSDRTWTWLAQDYSEGTLCAEKFAAKFKNADIAQLFHSVFENCQAISKASEEKKFESSVPAALPTSLGDSNNTEPSSGVCKSQNGSWQCCTCRVRNDASKQRCASCDSLKPESVMPITQSQSSTSANSITSCSEIKKSFGDLFKPAPDSWECQTCYVRNNKDASICVACESPKNQGESTSQMPTQQVSSNVFGHFSFGNSSKSPFATTAQSSTTNSSNFIFGNVLQTVTSSGFVFGTKPSTTPTTFDFGQSSVSQSHKEGFVFKPTQSIGGSLSSNTVFGGATISPTSGVVTSVASTTTISRSLNSISIPPVTSPPAYTFGNVSSETSTFSFAALASEGEKQESSEAVEFRFGSPQKYEFSFSGVRARSPSKTPKSPKVPGTPTDIEDEDEVEPSEVDNIYFQPVIPLPPKVDVKTGEEEETSVFSHRAKLFRFDTGEWKERGIGDIKILFNPVSRSYRLLMRREQVLKVCLNHKLTPDIKFVPKGDKSLQWAAVDFSDNEPKPEQLSVRFKAPETLTEFRNAIDDTQKKLYSTEAENKENICDISAELAQLSVGNEKVNAEMSRKAATPPVEKPVFGSVTAKNIASDSPSFGINLKDTETIGPASSSTTSKSPLRASLFSFKTAELSQSPFSLTPRFGESQIPAKSLFGSTSSTISSRSLFSSSAPDFSEVTDEDTEIEVLESKTASEDKRESAEKLQLPSNFYLYEEKPPCPGCRGCEKGHVETNEDVIEVIYEAKPSGAQIAAACELLLPPTFFLYENKPPCPGCRGCTDEIPDHFGLKDDEVEEAVEKQPEQLNSSTSTVISKEEIEIKPFFLNTTVSSSSFADLAAKGTGFEALASKTSPSKIVFAGAGAPVFEATGDSKGTEDDEGVVPAPDIHFEPVIPLPDLVDVKTGEEEETAIFCHRAKLYRYDSDVHQWKERGIGDFKILKHNEKCRFRIILRRDQVHKVACNHYINPDMKIFPLDTSETTLCWNTVDYADGRPETCNFAVRFKNKEILEQFQVKYNECVVSLSQESTKDSLPAEVSCVNSAPVSQVECAAAQPVSTQQVLHTDSEISNKEDSNEKSKEDVQEDNYGEEEDDGDDVLFEKRVSFEIFDEEAKTYKKAGLGPLRVLYDDTVFGYRINMVSDQNIILSDHIIAVQTSLRTDNKFANWAAIDMVVDPPRRRLFRATFSSVQALREFESIFNEGKQTAIKAQIVETIDDPPGNYHQYETDECC